MKESINLTAAIMALLGYFFGYIKWIHKKEQVKKESSLSKKLKLLDEKIGVISIHQKEFVEAIKAKCSDSSGSANSEILYFLVANSKEAELKKDFKRMGILGELWSIIIPDDPRAYYFQSFNGYCSGNYTDSLEKLQIAVKKNPEYDKAYYQMARVSGRISHIKLVDVILWLEKAIEIAPKPCYFYVRACELIRSRDDTNSLIRGIKEMEKCVQSRPSFPGFYQGLSDGYGSIGQKELSRISSVMENSVSWNWICDLRDQVATYIGYSFWLAFILLIVRALWAFSIITVLLFICLVFLICGLSLLACLLNEKRIFREDPYDYDDCKTMTREPLPALVKLVLWPWKPKYKKLLSNYNSKKSNLPDEANYELIREKMLIPEEQMPI
jgi:hypothetical protein